jgi:hypothetical protein
MEIIIKVIILELLLIFLLLLRAIGVTRRIYEELYTNPNTRIILILMGDILYMIGGSVVGAVVYTLFTTDQSFYFEAFVAGTVLIAVGAYLKRE